ncbi:MAG: DinB family protein [Candidatus Heimdallarchaeota archaeon]|nr:DinB family protein [Candidatus Heimdallarchaeota archaeon]
MINKSHETFREFLSHLPEEILDWRVHEFTSTVRDLITHIIQDQMWIVDYILEKKEEKHTIHKDISKLLIEEIISVYDDFVSVATEKLRKVKDSDLTDERDYKEYPLNVEDWLFEYIHHLNKHCGEINIAHIAWKRKERS